MMASDRRTMYLIDLLLYSLFSLVTAFAPGPGGTLTLTDVYLSEIPTVHRIPKLTV